LRVQGHFAASDPKCTQERVLALAGSLAAHGVASEIHRYDAANGFFNAARPEVFSAADAATAWARTLLFLRATLG
jgi:dienelactone hydrolase